MTTPSKLNCPLNWASASRNAGYSAGPPQRAFLLEPMNSIVPETSNWEERLQQALKSSKTLGTRAPNKRRSGNGRTLTEWHADFWARVKTTPDDNECWEWTGSLQGTRFPYGLVLSPARKTLKCHRVAAEIRYGPIPNGLLACHTCDNPKCCNPHHLFIGTYKDNAEDMTAKGRHHQIRGSDHVFAKLTEEQVSKIKREAPFRKRGWASATARAMGVRHQTILRIASNKSWKHID